jgi:hypothetical protein
VPDPNFGTRHTALAAKNDLKGREEISRGELKKSFGWVFFLQPPQSIDRLVPDPRQTMSLVVRDTVGSQHFFAVQNHPAFAFDKECVRRFGCPHGVRPL